MKYEGTFGRLVSAVCGALAFLCVGACGAPAMIGPEPNEPSTEPQATGAAEHLAAAKREEERIWKHKALYDPGAKQSIRRCNPKQTKGAQHALDCWVETVNPTAIHDVEMKAHNFRAAYHRKAARELQANEARACEGFADNVRESSPFARGHVLGVSPLEQPNGENNIKPELVGATIFLQPIDKVTVAELQRTMDCYAAHQAVIGYGPITTESDGSPLNEPGSRATVRELSHGYAVDVRADNPFAAQAIWLRAQQLAVVN